MVREAWVGGGLLAASLSCYALSLGAAQGQLLLGRPLDVSIPLVQPDGQGASDLCVSAHVFFADDPVSAGAVRTSVVATGVSSPRFSLRVQTTAPLTEMFARLDVKVGCAQPFTRSYVLLADLPASTSPGTHQTVSVPVPPKASATPPLSTDAISSSGQTSAPARPSAVKAVADPAKTRSSVVTRKSAAVPVVRPRLQLDPLELVAVMGQLQPALRLSIDVPALDSPDEDESAELAQRRQAARLLWQALNEDPAQSAALALRLEASEAEIQRVKAALSAAQAAADASQAQLAQEQDTRYTNPAFVALLLAFLAALAGLLVLSRRNGVGQRAALPAWWKTGAQSAPEKATVAANGNAKPALGAGAAKSSVGWVARFRAWARTRLAAKPAVVRKSTLGTGDDTGIHEEAWPVSRHAAMPRKEAGASRSHTDFTHSALFEGGRSVATEELFDLQQQVEFFISLGQADQAVEVLKTHLAECDDASPLVYLDLLKLHHELGQRQDYAALQARFNTLYSASVPDFDRYASSRRGLERYTAALSRIQALWPQPAVLDVIERSIFRGEPDESSEVFDLEAYRELLLLYGIARDVIERNTADATRTERSDSGQDDGPATSHWADTPVGTPSSAMLAGRETALQPLPLTMSAPAVQPAASDDLEALLSQPLENPELNPALDLDLSLDLELPAPDDATTPVAQASAAPAGSAGPDAVVAAVQPVATPTSGNGHILDLDFSELSAPEAFTIKKSGKPD